MTHYGGLVPAADQDLIHVSCKYLLIDASLHYKILEYILFLSLGHVTVGEGPAKVDVPPSIESWIRVASATWLQSNFQDIRLQGPQPYGSTSIGTFETMQDVPSIPYLDLHVSRGAEAYWPARLGHLIIRFPAQD